MSTEKRARITVLHGRNDQAIRRLSRHAREEIMGFQMTAWDKKLLKYENLRKADDGSLGKHRPEKALDEGWAILASCFEPRETGLRSDLIQKFWPASRSAGMVSASDKA